MNGILRRNFLTLTGVGLLVAVAEENTQPSSPGPNIVFILSDDQRWDALGCMGNPVIQTPHLDSLAKDGVLFKNAFVTTPICAVSRASFLTGQYARRHGINDFERLSSAAQLDETYPTLLRSHGYCTGFIGKWGIGANSNAHMDHCARQFDYWAGAGYQSNYWHERICPYASSNGFDNKAGNHCTCPPVGVEVRVGHAELKDLIHQETAIIPHKVEEFLAGRDAGKPFCLSVSFQSPHAPTSDFPDSTAELYDKVAKPNPPAATPALAHSLPDFLQRSLDSDKGARFAADHEALAVEIRHYFRMITAMDKGIGDILELLAKYRLAEYTVIIFTSDNGLFLGERGLYGRWLGYDPSLRLPCVIFDPRISADRRGICRQEQILNIDFAPTMLDLAGLPIPSGMQGSSIMPLVCGEAPTWRQEWYFDHVYRHNGAIEPSEGIRTPRWKYIRYFVQVPNVEELYDLDADRQEVRDLKAEPLHVAALVEMRTLCDKLSASVAGNIHR